MELYRIAESESGLSARELRECLLRSLEGKDPKRVLILPPDFTRFHSGAGPITNFLYHTLSERGAEVDVMPALGTHAPLSPAQRETMFGDVPAERFWVHDWHRDVIKLGEVPGNRISELTGGLWREGISVEVNRRVMDEDYDLIISPGQVVPHEVIGMSNHAKNIFVGVGGSDMINKSHIIGAVYGMERMMGRDHTPVRELFDYALESFLADRPILWVMTVATVLAGESRIH